MNCDTFQQLLSDFQKELLSPELRREAQAHLAACEECRWLVEPSPIGPEMNMDLTSAILSRTTGSACGRLQELACAFVDGELEEAQTTLVAGHLEHCPRCSALVASLVEMDAVLPTLALVDPGPHFTEEILLRTVRPLHIQPDPWTYSWPEFREFWMKLIRRPRICFEAAYLGTVAGVLVIQTPLPKLHVSAEVVEVLRGAQSRGLLEPLLHSTKHLVADVSDFERKSAEALRMRITRGGTGLGEEVSRETQSLGALWHRFTLEVVAWFQHVKQVLPSQVRTTKEGK